MKKAVVLGSFLAGATLLAALSLQAQTSSLNLGDSYYRYSQIEQDLTKELPSLRDEVKTILQNLNQKGVLGNDLKSLNDDIQALDNTLSKLRDDPNFDQVETMLDQVNNSIKQAQDAYNKKQVDKAKVLLKKAAVYTKILIDSPMMKMTQAQIDMDQASLRINSKDYIAAGSFINQALDHVQGIQIQGNEKLNQQMAQIKNKLVVLHQQAMLGKYKDDQDSRSVWKNMRQVQVDSLSHYYDLWSDSYNAIEP